MKENTGYLALRNEYEKQTTEWEKIVAKHISDQELLSKMYKKILKIQENEQYHFKICKRCQHTFQQIRCIDAQ